MADSDLENLKDEVAEKVGVPLKEAGENANLTARQIGKVGGNMVKRLVEFGKEKLDDVKDANPLD